jgi:hypothetical protein
MKAPLGGLPLETPCLWVGPEKKGGVISGFLRCAHPSGITVPPLNKRGFGGRPRGAKKEGIFIVFEWVAPLFFVDGL